MSPPASVACAAVPPEAVLEFNIEDGAVAAALKFKPGLVITETAEGFELQLFADVAGPAGKSVRPHELDGPDGKAFRAACVSLFSGSRELERLIAGDSTAPVVLPPAEFFALRRRAR